MTAVCDCCGCTDVKKAAKELLRPVCDCCGCTPSDCCCGYYPDEEESK